MSIIANGAQALIRKEQNTQHMTDKELERHNFLFWYDRATEEDLRIARINNAEELDRLLLEYKEDIEAIQFRRQCWANILKTNDK